MKYAWIAPVALGLIAACDSQPGLSRLSLRLMNTPANSVTSVVLDVARVEVHVEDAAQDGRPPTDGSIDQGLGWRPLAIDQPIDLAGLHSETSARALGEIDLPAGMITQLRIVLNPKGKHTATIDGKTCPLATAKVPPTGIKITHPFKAFHIGRSLRHAVWIDAPLDQMIVPGNGCADLKPVLRIRRFQTSGKDVAID